MFHPVTGTSGGTICPADDRWQRSILTGHKATTAKSKSCAGVVDDGTRYLPLLILEGVF